MAKTNIPKTIPVSSIILSTRISREFGGYNNLEDLAESVSHVGLINPITLVPLGDGTYGLDAGGRRFKSVTEILGVTELVHAATCVPGVAGFLLKSELQADELSRLKIEIAENLDREGVHWRDELELIHAGYELVKLRSDLEGETHLMRDFGRMLGVSYQKLQAAESIYEDVKERPELYADVNSVRGAYQKRLRAAEHAAIKMQAERSLVSHPLIRDSKEVSLPSEAQGEPQTSMEINLSKSFLNVNGIEYLEQIPAESVDHVVTDPDYAVSVERLSANSTSAASGVAQSSVSDSLSDLRRLIPAAYRAMRPGGFFCMWYDLDHHEKLQTWAVAAGFAVQRWPLTWHKTDFRSNGAPMYNFCKNQEWAMLCRKGNAVLAGAQMSSVLSGAVGDVSTVFGHPFAKPLWLWRDIYRAIAIPGQVVIDPCCGSGSASVAAAEMRLSPVGCEINPEHYPRLLLNLQVAYQRILGEKTKLHFT